MEILDHECASAVWLGIQGAAEWAVSKAGEAISWVRSKLLDAKGLLSAAKAGLDKIGNALKNGWEFLKGWFKEDPIAATAGVAAGVLTVGVVVVAGGAIIGGISGGIASLTAAAGTAASAAIAAGKVAAVALTAAGAIKSIGGFIVRGASQVYNFDWNITDADIRKQQESAMEGIIVSAGGAVGQALGGLICGATPGLATIQIDTKYMAKLWAIINEDTKEEILEAFTGLIQLTKQAAKKMAFLETYKNVRKWVKANIKTGIPTIDKAIAAWGNEGSKSWSFSSTIEEWTESFDNKVLGQAIANGVEEFMDSCTEALIQIV